MARKKAISDEKLIEKFDQYLVEECSNNAKLFKIPKFGEYLRSNGHPNVADTTIRRNKTFRKVINERKAQSQQDSYQIIIAHKTLDVDSFMMTNRTPKAVRRALVELDRYYKKIAEVALEYKREADKSREFQEKFEQQHHILTEKEQQLNEQLKVNKDLEAENKKLHELIKTSIYPEIANELLKAEGLLKSNTQIITDDYLNTKVLTADSKIQFNKESLILENHDRIINIKNLLDSKTKY